MTRVFQRALVTALLAIATTAFAADGGGRDVTVAIFSSRTVHALVLTPIGARSWIASCATCRHQALQAPLHLSAPVEIFAGGSLKVTESSTSESRQATGLWHVRSSSGGNDLDVVLTLPSERYVAGVLSAEASPQEPPQSLRALAVVARTYALNGTHYTAQPGHLSADLCDSTACQAMNLGPLSDAISQVIRDSAGETLWFGDHRADVYFSQSCGGVTEDVGAVWPQSHHVPYLRSHVDPYCVRLDRAAWHAEIPLTALAETAKVEGWRIPHKISAAQITQRSSSHRAILLSFTGDHGVTSSIAASALRLGLGRTLGWNRVRSDMYDIAIRNGNLIFDGHGHGHGVGLCQIGAKEMASQAMSARDILAFYFPGTTVRVLPKDLGWQETHLGPVDARSTAALTSSTKNKMLQSWTDARERFPTKMTVVPTVVFAPSTEIFRQLTTQPGWALASTQRATIVLQPDTVLSTQDFQTVLLHEMLHVQVEAESSDQAPLWLREGLVEALAGGPHLNPPVMSTREIESVLQNPDSLAASRKAHQAAESRVQSLIARYGASVVRSWLRAGVPAGSL